MIANRKKRKLNIFKKSFSELTRCSIFIDDKEFTRTTERSPGTAGAIAGAALYGPVGALLGSFLASEKIKEKELLVREISLDLAFGNSDKTIHKIIFFKAAAVGYYNIDADNDISREAQKYYDLFSTIINENQTRQTQLPL